MSDRLRRGCGAFLRRFAGTAGVCALLAAQAQAEVLFVRDTEVAASEQFVAELAGRIPGARAAEPLSVIAQDVDAGYQRLRNKAAAASADGDDETAFDFPPRTRSLGSLTPPPAPAAEEHRALQPAPADKPIVVAVGPAALRAVLRSPPREPVVAVLVSRSDVEDAGASAGAALYAIVTNQPARRQLALITLALPQSRRIGVVYPPDAEPLLAEIKAEARRLDVAVIARRSDSASALSPALAEVLPGADVLLLLADPVSLAAGVAQSVLRTAAASRKPVAASTEALVRAGALLGVFTTRSQFVEEAAEYIARLQKGERPPTIAMPTRFSVGVNQSVAHALALDVPDESLLQQRLAATP
jgi:putative ABC transport system substrate-binding protein